MTMNENEPNGKSLSPILSPETFAQKYPEPKIPLGTESSENETEKASSKAHRRKMILFGSLAVILVAGAVTAAVLITTGAFSKDKDETEPEEYEEMVETETEDVEETKETSATSAPTAAPAAAPSGQHVSVNSLNQITDEQIKIMDEHSRKVIREDGNSGEDGIPEQVTIDQMNYIGMIRQCIDYTGPDHDEKDMIQMVYQVQLTDNTGDQPVKRQYFWMHGFTDVCQDGTVGTSERKLMWTTLSFENWSAQGCLDVDYLFTEAAERNTVREKKIDKSLIQPFEGGSDEVHPVLTSIGQITPAMERDLEKGGYIWQEISGVFEGVQDNGIRVDNIEYAGLVFTVSPNKGMNRVYVIFRFDITDFNQTAPVNRSIYWYLGFNGLYEGGQLQTRVLMNKVYHPFHLGDWVDAPGTVEELRKFLQENETDGWTYEDNLDKEIENVKKKTESTEASASDSAA